MARGRMVPMRTRRGLTLPELLVAIPMALLVGTLALQLLLATLRHTRQVHLSLSVHQQLLAAREVLAADLRGLRLADLHVVSDTVLEVAGLRWIGLVCAVEEDAAGGQALLVTPLSSPSQGASGPRATDQLHGWERGDAVTASPIAVAHRLSADATAIGLRPCPPREGRIVPLWRVPWPTTATRSTRPEPGFPVIARRLLRYQLYRSQGRWWLGRRNPLSQGGDVLQPVAGPLASPSVGGLRVALLDREAVATSQPTRARALHIRMLAVGPSGLVVDSLGFVVPLSWWEAPHG
jgi:hypothetical protein